MYNQNAPQGQHAMLNGGAGHPQFMRAGIPRGVQHHNNQFHAHQHQQHQDHGGHGGMYANHQHSLSNGGLGNNAQHYSQNQMQNGTPNSVHAAINNAPNEHWAEQLRLARQAQDMRMTHSHARNHPSVGKNVVAGASNGTTQGETEERNRATSASNAAETNQIWTCLDCSGQHLKMISTALFRYDFLTELYLNNNKLSFLPPAIGRLQNLKFLDLSLNDLRVLPPEIGMLGKLKQLWTFHNHIEDLPYELGALSQLEILGIEGNPLNEQLKSVIMESGTGALVKYLRESTPPLDPPRERDWIEKDDCVSYMDDTFSVLTYNILCDRMATESQYPYTPSAAIHWDHRSKLILAELRARNADIICLQEVDVRNYNNYFREALAHDDYKGIFFPKGKARTMQDQEKEVVDGCAIFYKSSKYILIEKTCVDYANIAINRPDMKGEHDIFNRVMPRDDIAIISFFENRQTGSRLIVATTHIYWHTLYTDVKIVQVAILMAQMKLQADKWAKHPPLSDKEKAVFQYANGDLEDGEEPPEEVKTPAPSMSYEEGTHIPMVVCGDFNSEPDSGVCQLLSFGYLPREHPDLVGRRYGGITKEGIRHPFSLKSAYTTKELDFTNYTNTFKGVLDHIYYSTNSMRAVGVLGEIDKEYLERVPGFPNYHYPSDHIALQAQFVVTRKKEKKLITGGSEAGGSTASRSQATISQ
ncbi:hypothetical protein K402DRAFT_363672 [Aulographum hederae CBS 113979]|uniref:CCR4-Not complex 3'-5'-exoribonuclease subunit Ccr4 n=1 Tax=Aulographum hederae CBS 113979 TaxID=1176131 RepID=A0A6G1GMS2_9PEZI|nr:hypothetical protein K402DRAFT_363672 [Aulographum hederae CBS 113979]